MPFIDGLPASLFEIMSTNSIPIISNLENYHPFFKENKNGFYLNDLSSAEELAGIIIKVLKNYAELSKRISNNNNTYIRKYQNWKFQSANFIDFYQ